MGYWWCPSCKRELAAVSVTSEEKCDTCGYPVEWVEPEEHYRTSGLTFGKALELCRQGKRIYRDGWNGKNQFVYYQKGSIVPAEDLRCDTLKEWAYCKEGLLTLEIMGHFDIKTTSGVVQCGWLASQGDLQAEDWRVLE